MNKKLLAVVPVALAGTLLMAPSASAASKVCEGGPLMGASTKVVEVSAGQNIDITVHNHDYRGMLVQIIDDTFDKGLWSGGIAPGKEHTVKHGVLGEPPVGHKIRFEVTSNLSNNYTYKISSDRCY
ncbi:hypothetical protein [Amycolatopsis azurea]|uniref:Uncharacterized protein n=1 Tax=Amycolatopsis azurea DSM 43854 TaxID=1238180 RepID=M2NIB8_9PSEU|nr:hypothetical protein [Amycolatopsis azurea]EMD21864.1 hypothetical protein C791_0762 [Amycolatopsis azurea DSM 43854]OOC03867.1 hypothetical protein B0293_26795 [Amycolatopsis azurea DSM 43854]